MATNAGKPNGQFIIIHGREKEFLAPLLLNKIPIVGKKTFDKLVSLGKERIESVQKTTLEKMKQILGETGVYIWKKSNAICNSKVRNYREQKSMSCERTFSETVSNKKILNAKLVKMVEELSFDLSKQIKYLS